MKRIYLDNAAATILDPEVLSSMIPYFKESGNASSIHTSGRRAKEAIDDARERIADCIGAKSDEIIFTGSGTESDNLAILGFARANRNLGTHIIVSAIEHKAVLESVEVLLKEGFEISFAPVDEFGMIDIKSVLSLVREDTILISIMLGNNEIGTIQPISELSTALKRAGKHSELPYIHTDACQAAGFTQIAIKDLGVDLLTINGSKIYGPKGVGVLFKARDIRLSPLLAGGGQEYGLRAGTESVPLIVGMANALEKSIELMEDEVQRLKELREYFITQLKEKIPDIIINGHKENVLPHIVHVTIPKVEGESIVLMLDDVGVEVATGSACSAKNLRPSHVLVATGQDLELIHGSVRFSMGRDTKKEDLDVVLEKFSKVVQTLRNMSALTSKPYERDKQNM